MEKKAFIAYAKSKGSGEPAHSRSLARTYAVCSRKRQDKTSAKELGMKKDYRNDFTIQPTHKLYG